MWYHACMRNIHDIEDNQGNDYDYYYDTWGEYPEETYDPEIPGQIKIGGPYTPEFTEMANYANYLHSVYEKRKELGSRTAYTRAGT